MSHPCNPQGAVTSIACITEAKAAAVSCSTPATVALLRTTFAPAALSLVQEPCVTSATRQQKEGGRSSDNHKRYDDRILNVHRAKYLCSSSTLHDTGARRPESQHPLTCSQSTTRSVQSHCADPKSRTNLLRPNLGLRYSTGHLAAIFLSLPQTAALH